MHLRLLDKAVDYERVKEWKIVPLSSLFGGSSGYAIHVVYKDEPANSPKSWDRLLVLESYSDADAVLKAILLKITQTQNSGGGFLNIP